MPGCTLSGPPTQSRAAATSRRTTTSTSSSAKCASILVAVRRRLGGRRLTGDSDLPQQPHNAGLCAVRGRARPGRIAGQVSIIARSDRPRWHLAAVAERRRHRDRNNSHGPRCGRSQRRLARHSRASTRRCRRMPKGSSSSWNRSGNSGGEVQYDTEGGGPNDYVMRTGASGRTLDLPAG